jgi:apolipoprotein N-acyltransferase
VPAGAAALGLGLVNAASFSTAHGWWLQIVALAALLALLATPHPRPMARAAITGFVFGLASFCAGVGWLYISMHRYGGLAAPLAAAAVVLLSAYLALFGALALALAQCLAPAGRPGAGATLARIGALAACWMLGELARGWLFTGFPWLSLGYAQVDGPLVKIAAGIGVYGLGGTVVAIAAVLATLWRLRSHGAGTTLLATGVTGAAAVCLAGLGGSASIEPSGPAVAVRLLQGNVEQGMKFDPQRALRAMNDYTDDVLAGNALLTVLPETAWTTTWRGTPPAVSERLFAHLARSGGFVAIGLPERAPDPAGGTAGMLSNSVMVRGPDGEPVGRYDKRQLVPFGEYIPPAFGWFVRMMNIPLGEFARGADRQPPVRIGGQDFAFDICYEDLFPGLLREQVRDGASVLVNISNIAWFGDSHALGQHLNISRLRAIELGRPMLRATNTGMTASIDASGRVLAALEPVTRGALDIEVRGAAGLTPYVRFGHWPATGIAAFFLLALAARRRREARKS